ASAPSTPQPEPAAREASSPPSAPQPARVERDAPSSATAPEPAATDRRGSLSLPEAMAKALAERKAREARRDGSSRSSGPPSRDGARPSGSARGSLSPLENRR